MSVEAPLGRREVEVSRALMSRALKRNDIVESVCEGEGPSKDILLLNRLRRAGRRTKEGEKWVLLGLGGEKS